MVAPSSTHWKVPQLCAWGTQLWPWLEVTNVQLLWGFGGGGESFPEKPGPGLDPRLIGGPGYGGLFPFLALLTTEEPQTVQGKGAFMATPRSAYRCLGGLLRSKEGGFPGLL